MITQSPCGYPESSVILRIKKRGDGQTALTAVRGDGTFTTTVIGPAEGFGPVHDLCHFVVETSLGIANGFLGLLAAGRDIEDFNRGAKHWMPPEAMVAEAIAGQLSRDVMTGRPLSVEDFNWAIRQVTPHAPELSAEQPAALHSRLADLRGQWDALEPGEALELEF